MRNISLQIGEYPKFPWASRPIMVGEISHVHCVLEKFPSWELKSHLTQDFHGTPAMGFQQRGCVSRNAWYRTGYSYFKAESADQAVDLGMLYFQSEWWYDFDDEISGIKWSTTMANCGSTTLFRHTHWHVIWPNGDSSPVLSPWQLWLFCEGSEAFKCHLRGNSP